jgi:hypothetical protein
MYWWTKAATASARVTESTIVGKGAGVIRIGSTLRENPNPNTAGPDFLLTQSQMSQQQLRNTLFLGVQWVQWIRLALIAQKISFETRDVGLRVERHPLAMAPRGSPLSLLNYKSLSEAYKSKFSTTHG